MDCNPSSAAKVSTGNVKPEEEKVSYVTSIAIHNAQTTTDSQITTPHRLDFFNYSTLPPLMKGVDSLYPTCLLCLYPYPDTKLTPCTHHFHMKCLQKMLVRSPACPVCHQQILKFEQSNDFINAARAISQGGLYPSQSYLFPTALQPASEASLKARPHTHLRRGKWTPEEEAYANRLIQEFKTGYLPLTDGTTLRTFLAILLNCDPMRISKKYVGSQCIGKQVFKRKKPANEQETSEYIEKNREELVELERKFLYRINQQKVLRNKKMDSRTTSVASLFPATESRQDVLYQENVQTPNVSSTRSPPNITHAENGPVVNMPAYTESSVGNNRTSPSSYAHADMFRKQTDDQSRFEDQQQTNNCSSGPSNHIPTSNQNANVINSQCNSQNTIPKVLSMDNFSMFGIPRVDSFDGFSNFAFSRVPSFDNMLSFGMPMSRNSSAESLSSLCLPKVASMESLCSGNTNSSSGQMNSFSKSTTSNAFVNSQNSTKSSPLEPPPMSRIRSNGIPAGGLPRVPSLDKLSRPSSLLNLCSAAESASQSRPSSLEKLQGYTGGVFPRVHSNSNFAIPRVSSIEDILSLVASSEAKKQDSHTLSSQNMQYKYSASVRKRELDDSLEQHPKHRKIIEKNE